MDQRRTLRRRSLAVSANQHQRLRMADDGPLRLAQMLLEYMVMWVDVAPHKALAKPIGSICDQRREDQLNGCPALQHFPRHSRAVARPVTLIPERCWLGISPILRFFDSLTLLHRRPPSARRHALGWARLLSLTDEISGKPALVRGSAKAARGARYHSSIRGANRILDWR